MPAVLAVLTVWLLLSVVVVGGLGALFTGSRLGERRARRAVQEAMTPAEVAPLRRLPLAG